MTSLSMHLLDTIYKQISTCANEITAFIKFSRLKIVRAYAKSNVELNNSLVENDSPSPFDKKKWAPLVVCKKICLRGQTFQTQGELASPSRASLTG